MIDRMDDFLLTMAIVKTREEYKRIGKKHPNGKHTQSSKVIKAKRRNQAKGRKANRRKK